MSRRRSRSSMFDELNVPGIDPRHHVLTGRISNSDNSVRVDGGSVYVDIDLAGVDSHESESGQQVPEITAKWLYPSNGTGGIIFTGLPAKGSPCVVFAENGDPEMGCYAQSFSSKDYKLPSSVLADTASMHIVGPTGGSIKIGSRGSSSTKRAARVDDTIIVNSDTDATFIAFIQALKTAWNAATTSGGPLIVPLGPQFGFSAINGKINKGSSRVLIGGDSVS